MSTSTSTCIYIYTCICAHTFTLSHVCPYVHEHTCTQPHSQTCPNISGHTHAHTHTHMHVCPYIHEQGCTHILTMPKYRWARIYTHYTYTYACLPTLSHMCAHMYMSTRVHTHNLTHVPIYMWTHIHTCMYTQTPTYVPIYTWVHIYTTYTHMHTHTLLHVSVYMWAHIYTCMYHTHMQGNITKRIMDTRPVISMGLSQWWSCPMAQSVLTDDLDALVTGSAAWVMPSLFSASHRNPHVHQRPRS